MSLKLKSGISVLLLILALWMSIQFIIQARQNQQIKSDLAQINHIRYGLLSVDEWSEQLSTILSLKILEFRLTPENREVLHQNLVQILNRLVDELETMMRERTAGQFSGVKRWLAGIAINMDQIRDSVPSFADQVIDELGQPGTRETLQDFLSEKLDDITASTYSLDSRQLMEDLLDKYDCSDRIQCQEELSKIIAERNQAIHLRTWGILFLVVIIFILNSLGKQRLFPEQVLILILASFCLLIPGISTPMIDLEARIDSLVFLLLDEEVRFSNNIIFFQSKSIFDVIQVLFEDGSVEMIFVGILIFTFSVIFPSVKLISSGIITYLPRLQHSSSILRFFAFKSGKWSMADVMVVAMFMAYVGFNGIMQGQMNHLAADSDQMTVLTTNGTSLLDGFYLFLLFCLSSLLLSEILFRKQIKSSQNNEKKSN